MRVICFFIMSLIIVWVFSLYIGGMPWWWVIGTAMLATPVMMNETKGVQNEFSNY